MTKCAEAARETTRYLEDALLSGGDRFEWSGVDGDGGDGGGGGGGRGEDATERSNRGKKGMMGRRGSSIAPGNGGVAGGKRRSGGAGEGRNDRGDLLRRSRVRRQEGGEGPRRGVGGEEASSRRIRRRRRRRRGRGRRPRSRRSSASIRRRRLRRRPAAAAPSPAAGIAREAPEARRLRA